MKKYLKYIIPLILTFVLLELCLMLAIRTLAIPAEIPAYSWKNFKQPSFFIEHELFGVWHSPNVQVISRKQCFNAIYSSNSYGARDIERTVASEKHRVMAIGDSFIEGAGVNDEYRLTNLLEKKSGLEHLNLGTSGHFGPTQESILYEYFSERFDYNYILIGILPYNDFKDNDLEYGKKAHANLYRPYYTGTYPNYKITYYNQPNVKIPFKDLRKFLKGFTYTYNALLYVKDLFKHSATTTTNAPYAGYYDYTLEDLNKMRFAIERIKLIADKLNKPITIFTIPTSQDFLRFKENELSSPLNLEFEKLSKELGFEYIDLLPAMYERESEWSNYFLPCDGHWNHLGNKIASEILFEKSIIYR